MIMQTIGEVTAELVQRGIPRWDKESHHPPLSWWVFTDTTDEMVEVIHVVGRTENELEWQIEVICCLHGHVDVLNVIDPDITEVIASLQVWPGLPEAIEFALMSQRIWDSGYYGALAEQEEEVQ
ncbi:hypothetical protein KBY83_12610 [Cyanobium sp. WKJ7-Wakatipu]|uniref:hypothetical protein n=1 Tax=Cyanobium sp. WKJ7-Wakatipu TaxID=2823726 RepID=UPI0020CDB941|nr:hypothetical protein [Cyanobium sp. WKJ7-Wakatipu]MCP9784142.1 hypothetical protein [Cyanobium sp. WKJ7-Wakatipu]